MALGESVVRHRPLRFQEALQESTRMLRDQFGNVDQQAAVSLAIFLYTSGERQEFLERSGVPDDLPYGGQ
ncbi:MAG TPA: hypothetical protein VI997_01325 [Candidatus Thermoplasmatota archaeon]|nr:hypothetical protein [Candidatus Thermoplasmatota archaeon]